MTAPAAPPPPADAPSLQLQAKAALLIALFLALVAGTVLYLLYARGTFETTQRLVLLADDAEGVSVGMDLTFSGFPIGRVRRIELAPDGEARILVDVPRSDAHWLRSSSVFTLVRGIVGGAKLRAYSGVMSDPPLAGGAVRKVLIGDTNAELQQVVSTAHELMQNLAQLTSADSALATSLGNVQALTERIKGRSGAMGVLLGNDHDAQQLSQALARSNALLGRLDGIAAKADQQVLGPHGVVQESRATVMQLNAMLVDARATLKRVDAVLAEAQAVAANAHEATNDLGALRGEVDRTLAQVEQLVNEVNRKWPFAHDSQLQLK
jgi:phospholipid/cholesterol/gamma-HCH transport system substrate-binding protein